MEAMEAMEAMAATVALTTSTSGDLRLPTGAEVVDRG